MKGCFVSEIKDKEFTIICDSIEECKEETKFVDSSFVKIYDHELSYDEIAKEFEKSKEEAKNSGKFITTANQQFPTATLKKLKVKWTAELAPCEQDIEKQKDWREARYDRYDKE
jgi:hypothetical protein